MSQAAEVTPAHQSQFTNGKSKRSDVPRGTLPGPQNSSSPKASKVCPQFWSHCSEVAGSTLTSPCPGVPGQTGALAAPALGLPTLDALPFLQSHNSPQRRPFANKLIVNHYKYCFSSNVPACSHESSDPQPALQPNLMRKAKDFPVLFGDLGHLC